MEQEKNNKNGYLIVTYQVRLYDRHFTWIKNTKELYGAVVAHFLQVLQKEPQLLEFSNFLLLRELELKCIGTKETKRKELSPEYPFLGFPKIPLYFRRSAINAAIDLARKQAGRGIIEGSTQASMTLYKGMYQEFTNTSICIKLWQGERWVWVTYPFAGRPFPVGADRLSPVLVIKKQQAYLNVPCSIPVSDIRTVKERMQQEERICAVSFPDYDVLAVAVILSMDGVVLEQKFFRGGKRKEHQRKRILREIQKSKESRKNVSKTELKQSKRTGEKEAVTKENAHWYQKLQDINKHYSHNISRQIVEYCVAHEIRILVVPKYEKSIDFRQKRYLKTDEYRWLGRSIIQQLKYKAFAKGIIVTSIRPIYGSDRCSDCGAPIKKYNEGHPAGKTYYGGKLFLCPNGHRGNSAENAAKNIGRNFLSFYQEVEKE